MQQWIPLFVAALLELLILIYVIAFVVTHVIPWDDLREKRRLRVRIAGLLPSLRERAVTLVAKANAAGPVISVSEYRELGGKIAEDVRTIAEACLRLLGVAAQEYRRSPREVHGIVRDVSSTLDAAERMLALRDVSLPQLAVRMVETVGERIDMLESLRTVLLARALEEEDAGIPMAYERRRLSMLSNAFAAHRGIAASEPDKVTATVPTWTATLRAIAESIELRAAVVRRVREVVRDLPGRVAQLRALAEAVRPGFVEKDGPSPHQSVAARAALSFAAENGIERAHEELRRAETLVRADGRDLGAKGETAAQLVAALRHAELSIAVVASFEKDLVTVLAALAAGTDRDLRN